MYQEYDLNPDNLSEEVGARLGLVFLAVKPLTKIGHVEQTSHGIRQMPSEEAITGTANAPPPTSSTALKKRCGCCGQPSNCAE